MARVTADDILRFNQLYFKHKTYTAVARETGFSASTVSKYVDKNWKPADNENRKIFDPTTLEKEYDLSKFSGLKDFGALCVLSESEKEDIKELWKEMEL